MRNLAADLRAQPIINWHPNPKLDNNATPFFAANASVLTRVADTRFGGAFSLKVDFPSGGVADSGVNLTTGISAASLGLGRTFTISFDIYALDTGGSSFRFSRQGGSTSGSPINTAFTAPVGFVVRRAFTFSTLSNNNLSIYILRNTAGQVGTFYVSNFMIVEGSYFSPFRDGSYPGWKWRGTAGSTPSVGWPR